MKLNIVLFEPEIPQNVGNIARTCVGFDCVLHLIKPYGFIFKNKEMIRSGLDYWKNLKLVEHDDYQSFIKSINVDSKIFYISRYGKLLPNDIKIKQNNKSDELFLVFGKESTGVPKDILVKNLNNTVRIPTSKNVRSLNLSNCVAIFVYEINRQNNFNGLELLEPHKKHYLF